MNAAGKYEGHGGGPGSVLEQAPGHYLGSHNACAADAYKKYEAFLP